MFLAFLAATTSQDGPKKATDIASNCPALFGTRMRGWCRRLLGKMEKLKHRASFFCSFCTSTMLALAGFCTLRPGKPTKSLRLSKTQHIFSPIAMDAFDAQDECPQMEVLVEKQGWEESLEGCAGEDTNSVTSYHHKAEKRLGSRAHGGDGRLYNNLNTVYLHVRRIECFNRCLF